MKIRPVGSEMSHADGQKDMTKLILAFLSFANTPNTDGTSLDGLHHAAAGATGGGGGGGDFGGIKGGKILDLNVWLSSNDERLNAHGPKPRTPPMQFTEWLSATPHYRPP